MTDIVERLRDFSRGGWPDADEAADEIERLRAALDKIDKFITAIAPTKLTKELDSIRHEVRALQGR